MKTTGIILFLGLIILSTVSYGSPIVGIDDLNYSSGTEGSIPEDLITGIIAFLSVLLPVRFFS
ncbi:MAG: hypothetical protein AAF824_09150 [Bacteroidota bacterium]